MERIAITHLVDKNRSRDTIKLSDLLEIEIKEQIKSLRTTSEIAIKSGVSFLYSLTIVLGS